MGVRVVREKEVMGVMVVGNGGGGRWGKEDGWGREGGGGE